MNSASVTAKRVAAQRLTFQRPDAGFGRPADDDRIARDVAGEQLADPASPLRRYLEARTRFFDQVVIDAIAAGVRQIVIGAVGYDGRALRFAKPGVRWFELDHPATQRDKRERLLRLGIETPDVAFVAADFVTDPVATRLREAGVDPTRAALFTLEGVAVYLDIDVFAGLLRDLRSVAAAGSTLAISLSVASTNRRQSARRAAFERSVAAVGEPARSTVEPADVAALFESCGWRPLDDPVASKRRDAGFVIARA